MMSEPLVMALCGDVMTGRGIDQILPRPCPPELYEAGVTSARDYVALAEAVNGAIPSPADFSYIWGDAPAALARLKPAAWVVNLETSITRAERAEDKGINYRMSPENARCLAAVGISCCALANNHVLDWGRDGLLDTMETLDALPIRHAGAGRTSAEAAVPAILAGHGRGRLLVFAFGVADSGIPAAWAATPARPGVNLLRQLTPAAVADINKAVGAVKKPGDVAVLSLHWGGNWGYEVSDEERRFAHALIDGAGIDVIHGHSSHHPRGIEVYRGKLILYGCGDFINDYEGISGYEAYRGDLALLYGLSLEPPTGRLLSLSMTPFRIRKFRLHRASAEDAAWLARTLSNASAPFGARVTAGSDGALDLAWP